MDDFDLRLWPGYLATRNLESEQALIDQVAIDTRRINSPNSLFVALKGNKDDGHNHLEAAKAAGAKYALISDDCPVVAIPGLILLRVPNPLKALQEIAMTYRQQLPTKILGITGSFGKTMVKDLLYSLLKTEKQTAASPESFNSQIGVALSLLSIRKKDEIAIIEAAISEKEEMNHLSEMIRPDFSLLTPIGNKHLATLQNLSILSEEVWKLVKATNQNGWALIPNEKDNYNPFVETLKAPCFYWDVPQVDFPHAEFVEHSNRSLYQIKFPDQSTFQGKISLGHSYFLNLINMSIKAAWLLGVSSKHICKTLQHYQPEPSRTEIWKSNLGTTFVNDIYCADPQSIDHSMSFFEFAEQNQIRIFVFGGMRGQTPYSAICYKRIGQTLAKANIRYLYLIDKKPYHSLVDEMLLHSPKTEILAFESYEEAFPYLKAHFKANDFVIFKGESKIPLEVITTNFNESRPNNQCQINLVAIQNNLTLIRKKLPKETRLMVIVKALAYGTDDIRMAKFLQTCGIDILGVSYVDEAVALKQSGVKQNIFAINVAPYETSKVAKWNIEVGVSDISIIKALAEEANKQNRHIKVHLHINTGMGRFGCRPEEALNLAETIISFPSLELEGVMTHFACADDPNEDTFTLNQVKIFDEIIADLAAHGINPKWKHAANSSGSLRFSLPQYNMVRVGLAAYGLYGSEAVKESLNLRLALSLTSHIVAINECNEGETVGYGRRYSVKKERQKIAILPIGYFDGLHRHYSEKAYVLIQGQKAPMVGNICMDYMMIDVTDIPQVAVGDKVLIFGEDEYGFYLSPEELANHGDSIIHELITCLGPRIARVFIYEESDRMR